jgi:hypothetical protein
MLGIVVPPGMILVTVCGPKMCRVCSMGPAMPLMLIVPIAVGVANRNISYVKAHTNGRIGHLGAPYCSAKQYNHNREYFALHTYFSCPEVLKKGNDSARRRFRQTGRGTFHHDVVVAINRNQPIG